MYFLCRIITLAPWRVLDINKRAASRRNQAPAETKRNDRRNRNAERPKTKICNEDANANEAGASRLM